jgi:L-fucose isomerase-like protein
MLTPTKIACLPIGQGWEPALRARFDEVVSRLGSGVAVDVLAPAYSETEVLDRLAGPELHKSSFLLIAALEGGSARQIVLAATRSNLSTGIWCHNENHSLASSALAAEALRQLRRPFVLLGEQSGDELDHAIRAAAAKRELARARIGKLGPTHFNLVGGNTNPLVLFERFGSWVVPLSIAGLREHHNEIAEERIDAEVDDLRRRFCISAAELTLRNAVAMHLALKDLAAENRLDAVAIDCWNEIVPEFGVSPDLVFVEEELVLSTEGDLAVAVMMLAGRAMSAGQGYVGDLYSFDQQTGEAILMHCSGPAALHGSSTRMEIAEQCPPVPMQNLGKVVACRPILPVGTATLLLLHGERLERLHLRQCEITETDFPDQMRVRVTINGDLREFCRNIAGNHYVVFPGYHAEAWRLWARWSEVQLDEGTWP